MHGRSILAHVHDRARRIRGFERVLVATDDERIAAEVRRLGGEVVLTSAGHVSGTDRIGEVLDGLSPPPDIVVNLQGDEPLLSPRAVERMLEAMRRQPDAIWTLADRIRTAEEFARPSVTKVVCAADGRALYFSRAPVPHPRMPAAGETPWSRARRHIGVYGYPRALLRAFLAAPPSPLELLEGLEQLRALELGITIRVLEARWPDAAVDTPEDLARLQKLYPTPEALAAAGADEDEPAGGRIHG